MKDYKKILEGVVNIISTTEKSDIGFSNICAYICENFPELQEREDEKIRKWLIDWVKAVNWSKQFTITKEQVLAWLEKQGKTITVDIDKMVDEFAHTEVKDYGTPSMIEVDAYRKGINDTLRLGLKLEKQGEKDKVTIKKGEQEPIEWKDSDEKYLFWALLSIQKDIAASEINGVNTKDLNDCVKWLYSLKQRIKGE